jgi:hypothetical protein
MKHELTPKQIEQHRRRLLKLWRETMHDDEVRDLRRMFKRLPTRSRWQRMRPRKQ